MVIEEIDVDTEELFRFLAHGDEAHRAWLREAIEAYFLHLPRPDVVPVEAWRPRYRKLKLR